MAITKVVSGNTMQAADLNQALTVLQQSSGGQEISKLDLEGGCYATGCVLSQWMNTWSRGSSLVSVTYSAATYGPSNIGSPATSHMSIYGFQTYVTSTAAATDCYGGWTWTAQY